MQGKTALNETYMDLFFCSLLQKEITNNKEKKPNHNCLKNA